MQAPGLGTPGAFPPEAVGRCQPKVARTQQSSNLLRRKRACQYVPVSTREYVKYGDLCTREKRLDFGGVALSLGLLQGYDTLGS